MSLHTLNPSRRGIDPGARDCAGLVHPAGHGAAWHWLAACLMPASAAALAAAPGAQRYQAPISISAPAPFIQLALPVAALAYSRRADLADLLLQDARGQPLPFALLPARDPAQQPRDQLQSTRLFPWPQMQADAALPATVKVTLDGARIELRAQPAAKAGAALAGGLIDLGPRDAAQSAPTALHVRWDARTPPFSAALRLHSSHDLRQWSPAGSAQVLALATPTDTLTQQRVPLPATAGRFIRLSWLDGASAPVLQGVDAVREHSDEVGGDAPLVLRLRHSAEPAAGAAGDAGGATQPITPPGRPQRPVPADPQAARALHVDLGAVLELHRLTLILSAGNQVLPLRVQRRARVDEPWADAGRAVFHRLERGTEVDVSPPFKLSSSARYLRLLPDERGAAPDLANTQVEVQVREPQLVFVAQGTPPFELRLGSANAVNAALPLSQLLPRLDQERPRFGRASVGAVSELGDVAQAEASAAQWARWRPGLLWAVLALGVGGLGFMVWRLARGATGPTKVD